MTFDYMKPNQNQFVNQKNIKDKPEVEEDGVDGKCANFYFKAE